MLNSPKTSRLALSDSQTTAAVAAEVLLAVV